MKHSKLRIYMPLIWGITLMVNGCVSSNNQATSRETTKENSASMQTEAVSKNDIVSHMPLDLAMVQYANHEYYAELPFTPVFDENRTLKIKAGHVYYWDGWNAFVINYIDYDILPYKVVHIGEITDQSVVDVLMSAEDQITIKVTEKNRRMNQ